MQWLVSGDLFGQLWVWACPNAQIFKMLEWDEAIRPKINSWDQNEPENGQKLPIVFVFQEKTALFSVQCISKSIFKDFVHLLTLCAKCAQKQVFLLIFRVKIRRYGLGPKTKNVRHVEKNKIWKNKKISARGFWDIWKRAQKTGVFAP